MPEDLEVVVEAYEDELTERLVHWRDVLVRHDRVREHLGDIDPGAVRVLGPALLGRKHDENSPFVATLFDPRENRSVEVRGRLDGDDVEVTPSAFRPNPTGDELGAALEVLRDDREFAELRDRDDVVVYQPMPPLADVERDDGTTVRRIALAVFDPRAERPHRYVAVDISDRLVDWDPGPFHTLDGDCEDRLPVGVESLPHDEGRDWVRVRVLRGGEELWNLVVVRPRASAPTQLGKGSGVELKYVTYRGRLVLWQAHVPILNVVYDDGVSYRDWQNQETLSSPTVSTRSGPAGGCVRLPRQRSWSPGPTPGTSKASRCTTRTASCESSARSRPAGTATSRTGDCATTAPSRRGSGSPGPAIPGPACDTSTTCTGAWISTSRAPATTSSSNAA
ncbi:hypothetical protein GCM10009789_66990 [Kribbella sancticallisti]|uniref:Uncharacterized protein n=1 Tax=Kribbella sancticallisti TaxID=460087 RepID=A0ABN2ECP3_9ACTN